MTGTRILAVGAVSLIVLCAAGQLAAQPNVRVVIDTEKPIATLLGFGAEWDPFFWRSFNAQHGCDDADWELIKNRIRLAQPDIFRVMVQPQWYEPSNDNDDPDVTDMDAFTWDSAEMTSLYRHLDVCDELNIDVNITVWGAPVGGGETPYWMANPTGSWITAPNDAGEWAENLEALLVHLIRHRNYQCITYLTQMNEPNLAFERGRRRLTFDYFADFARPAVKRIRKAGFADRIKFMNPDAALWDKFTWLSAAVKDLGSVTDVYAIHSYNSSAAEPDFMRKMRIWGARAKKIVGEAPVFLSEYGDNNSVGAYSNRMIDTYERGLFSAAAAVALLNGGVAGICHWTLHDEYYYEGESQAVENAGLMMLGLWRYKSDDWRPRPLYYSWSLLTRYTAKGDQVYAGRTTEPGAGVCALGNSGGLWTLLAANTLAEAANFTVLFEGREGVKLAGYVYRRDALPEDDSLIGPSGEVTCGGSGAKFSLPPRSFAVFTNRP